MNIRTFIPIPIPIRVILLIVLATGLVGLIRFVYNPSQGSEPTDYSQDSISDGYAHGKFRLFPRHGADPGSTETVIFYAFNEVDRIEQMMSEWIAGSPINTINNAAGGEGIESPE